MCSARTEAFSVRSPEESLPNKRIQKSSAGNCKEKGTNIVNGSVSISGTAATNNVADMKDRGSMLIR
jgi:hypothetical protein